MLVLNHFFKKFQYIKSSWIHSFTSFENVYIRYSFTVWFNSMYYVCNSWFMDQYSHRLFINSSLFTKSFGTNIDNIRNRYRNSSIKKQRFVIFIVYTLYNLTFTFNKSSTERIRSIRSMLSSPIPTSTMIVSAQNQVRPYFSKKTYFINWFSF